MDLNAAGAVPALPFQLGVCGICHYWAPANRMYCDSCIAACAANGFEINPNKPMIRPLDTQGALAARGLQMFTRANSNSKSYLAGWQYKNRSEDVQEIDRLDAQSFMAEVMNYGFSHEACLAKTLGLGSNQFDIVTWVPSKRPEAPEHMLSKMLAHSTGKDRVRPVLTFDGEGIQDGQGHDWRKYVWNVSFDTDSAPYSVLLIDDLWTAGYTMLSAAAALFDAGVTRVGMLSLGRHVNRYRSNHSPNSIFEEYVRTLTIDARYCALCDERAELYPTPSLAERYGEHEDSARTETNLVNVKAGPDWSSERVRSLADLGGAEVWCREFKYGQVVEYFEDDQTVLIDFGLMRRRRLPISGSGLRWKPEVT